VNTNKDYNLPSVKTIRSIYSITPFTLIDYPDKTACILWFAGCNMRCVYCYNPDIVLGKGKLNFQDALNFIQSRKKLLDGVVFSGGECTLHPMIIDLVREVKKLGMLVKIDTNGSRPNVLKKLIGENLVDYVSLDFKSTQKKYYGITNSHLFEQFANSLMILTKSAIPFEVRTTIHSDLLEQFDIQKMINFLESKNYSGKYYLQNYINDVATLGDINNSKKLFIEPAKLKTNLEVIFR